MARSDRQGIAIRQTTYITSVPTIRRVKENLEPYLTIRSMKVMLAAWFSNGTERLVHEP